MSWDILVTSRRDTTAATRFFRKLLKGMEYVPRVLVTDKLGSYRAARRRVLRSVEHHRSTYLNNRAENFSPADPGAGTSDEDVHLSPARAAVSLRVQRDLTALPDLAATCCPPRNTDARGTPDSPPGIRSRARPRQPPERRSTDRLGAQLRFHVSISSPKFTKLIMPR
jgi:hypothetical protein